MKFEIAIPSYKRSDKIVDMTIGYLARIGFPADRVTIFVADEGERRLYIKALLKTPYRPKLVVGVRGMKEIRNFVTQYYPEGTRLLFMDDDLKGIMFKVDDKRTKDIEKGSEFSSVVVKGFEACKATKAHLWGVYPVQNPMFMKVRITSDLKYICGGFYGVIVRHDPDLFAELDDKEDFERSIKFYLRDGAVVRLEYIALATQGYTGAGGMQEDRTMERIAWSSENLAQRYPLHCSLNLTKKSGFPEVRLRDKTLTK